MSLLVVCDHDRGTITEASLEALTFGRPLAAAAGIEMAAVVIGEGAERAAADLGAHGASTVHLASHGLLTDFGPEAWGETVAQLVRATGATAVLACGTDRGNEVVAQVAARLDEPFVANCSSIRPGTGDWAMTANTGGFAACGDWMLRMHADFTVGADGAAVGNWVGPLVMVDPNVPVAFGEMEAASTKDFPIELFNPQITDPVWSNETNTRDMTGYNIYRDGAMVGDQDPDWTDYWDEALEWGTYCYYVTAQYDDHESIGTNEVEVTLSNVPPDAVMLISPGDGLEISIDEGNLDEEVAFIWTAANDADNDPVEYYLVAEGVVGEDSVWQVIPDNSLGNASFEDTYDNDGWVLPSPPWEGFPHQNSQTVVFTGETMFNSEETIEAWDGDGSVKLWG